MLWCVLTPRLTLASHNQFNVVVGAGIVLAKEGGALGKMLPVFNIFAGGPLGTGRQWCSWIHRYVMPETYLVMMLVGGHAVHVENDRKGRA